MPNNWAITSFEEIVELISGRDLETSSCNDIKEGIPYLIGASNIVKRSLFITRWTTKPIVISQKNDILISCKGTIGEVIRNTIGDIHIARQFMALRNNSIVDTNYIELYIRAILERIKSDARGVIPGISREDILCREILLPPLNEQKRIVLEASKLISIIEKINVDKNELVKAIAAYKLTILQLAITGKLVPQDLSDEPAIDLLRRVNPNYKPCDNRHYANVPFEIPKSWCWTTLGRIGKWQSGATPSRKKKEYYGGDIPWLKTGDLNDGFIRNIPESITSLALQETSVKLNPAGSVLLAMYGATIGKLGILTTPATTNQACCACVSYNGVEQMYLFYFLLSHRSEFVNQGGGGAQPNISKDKIIETLIPIPPLNEQRRIVQAVRSIFSILDRVVTDL